MPISYSQPVRQHAPALAVLFFCIFLTISAYLFDQGRTRERIALHASSDATEFQHTLQHGIQAYLHLNRDMAAHFTVAAPQSGSEFDNYSRAAGLVQEYPGLSYVGYVGRIARPHIGGAKQVTARAEAVAIPPVGPDQNYFYPYLYAYPSDDRSRAAKGMDSSLVPERWAAMQRARDTGSSTATAKHFFVAGRSRIPVILVFTPVYDPALPNGTLDERRAALRGFVFAIFHVEEMIERVMGANFRGLFDLEVYDDKVEKDAILYDGDARPHVLLDDKDLIARHSSVAIAGRIWRLFFFPKASYVERYDSWHGPAILIAGITLSAMLAWIAWIWTGRLLARSRGHASALQFDAVFGNHPSPVYAFDLHRRFTHANAHALTELKCTREELVGKFAEHFIVPEKQGLAKTRFNDAINGNSVSYDSAIVDNAGARVELSVIMIPIKAGDTVTGVLGICENITARKEAVWRLKESRAMLQLVIDHLPQRVFWKDTNFRYIGCNKAVLQDAGVESPECIIGHTDYDLAWRTSADLYRKDDADLLASGVSRINYEERQHRADGSASWLRTSKIPLTDMDGNIIALLGMYEDITDRKNMEHQLRELAHYDSLTGLVNRPFFYHHLAQAIAKSRRHGSPLALMYFDIDRFKTINDTYGHDVGDALLKAFAKRIGTTVREIDTFARLGGDEFALLIEDLPNHAAAERVASKLIEKLQTPFQLGQHTFSVTSSIGIAFFSHGIAADELIKRADQAMYLAKRGGRNRFEVHQSSENTSARA